MSAPAPESPPRTLADQFRSWSDERLAVLLGARPDLGVPVPQDSAQLAARVSTRPSVMRALDGLSFLQLTVLEATLHLAPTAAADVHAVVNASEDSVDAALQRLLDVALLWGTTADLRPVTVLADVLASPRGPAVADVPALLTDLPSPAGALLDHLDERDADGRTESLTEPVEQLLARRLVVLRDDRRHVTVPWSVRVALRGGRSSREPADVVPPIATGDRDQAAVDRFAAGAAFELVRRTELLLDHWGSQPPGVLRAGGLSVRDLRATAGLLHVEPAEAGLVVETAAAAGLLAPGSADDVDPAWLPTDGYDAWVARPVAQRWEHLAAAWLANPRLTGLVGGRDEVDRPVNALSPELERIWLVATRRGALEVLAGVDGVLAPGTGVASFLARMRWHAPRRPASREQAVTWTIEEAALVGLTGLGGMSSYGRSLLSGTDPAKALAALLPASVDHVLIQADLTAVAPGPLEQELARSLSLVADVESRGGATVYRFSADSVRRAFDAGWSALEIKAFLDDSSRTPVPQALDYLVDDVSRRFGTLRVGTAESFLRSDDESALTELVHNPAAESLRLRRIAPTVVISDVPLQVLLPRLRELGTAPVVEAADGTVRIARPDVFRTRTRRPQRTGAGIDVGRQAARTTAMVAAIRSGDRVAASRPAGVSASSPGDVLSLLRGAVETEHQVWIGYVDNHGARVERVVAPMSVEGGLLLAHDPRDGDIRSFAVHRISSAHLV
ncbi:MAG: helicase-associated domain-containing protein [Marmoricola sp.]